MLHSSGKIIAPRRRTVRNDRADEWASSSPSSIAALHLKRSNRRRGRGEQFPRGLKRRCVRDEYAPGREGKGKAEVFGPELISMLVITIICAGAVIIIIHLLCKSINQLQCRPLQPPPPPPPTEVRTVCLCVPQVRPTSGNSSLLLEVDTRARR